MPPRLETNVLKREIISFFMKPDYAALGWPKLIEHIRSISDHSEAEILEILKEVKQDLNRKQL